MTAIFTPHDESARRRIREALDETLFVEAGAGTGKTTSLVDRVVGLVSSGRAALGSIAAITFTEAAAAELRDKIREALERNAAGPHSTQEERERCHRGVEDLDQASIQTLHSFAANLLQERPLEAGLPPSFEIMDTISGELAFDEVWTAWLDSAMEDTELAPALSLAFSLGLSPVHLRSVALRFHADYDQIMDVTFDGPPMPRPSAVPELVKSAVELERLCGFSKLQDADPLFSHVYGLLGSIRRLSEMEPDSPFAYRLLKRIIPIKFSKGSKGNWENDPDSGENACTSLKNCLAELDERAREELSEVRRSVIIPLLRAIQSRILEYSQERKRQGRAGFHDLLVWTRDLLRDNIQIRDHFRERFSHLLIDEAQDTDPIQTEIAMFLSEDVPNSTRDEDRPRSWEEINPAPGKLFVVGDPKQSIYRFRRADIRQMARLQTRLGGEPVRLVQNFRSQRPVIAWVNHVFERWMTQGTGQAEYVSVRHRWEAAVDHPAKPRVWSLGGAQADGTIGPVRRKEARAIASLLKAIVSGEWQVLDVEATASSGEERYRAATYSDVCILMPRRTALRMLEVAMDDAGIPYRLEGASLVFGTQEVRDLINCLKAIDDPADQVATVAALRSPAFACNDIELLGFAEAGGKFDYISEEDTPEGPVADAFEVLRRYHKDRLWTSIASLIDRFVRDRLLMEAALDHPRTREQWRRYRFMVEQARAFAAAGGNSLRAFLEWVERQAAEGARVTEVPVPEVDEEAVRVMTVHAAKGLEFPVVVLTGLNADRSLRSDGVLFDREGKTAEVNIGTSDNQFTTQGYEELVDKERGMEEAEFVRLLYVATTRARDHLVLSMYRTERDSATAAATIAGFLDGEDGLWEPAPELSEDVPESKSAPDSTGDLEGHSLEERERWIVQRRQTLEKQGRPVSVAATRLARIAKEEPITEEPWKRGRGGTSLGRAVH
ncbi:MAG: UvrD-helicase domain-containing protein, partial [Chloroflexi bacterium]|nr:UvrD-helicase domain-containing protein [Chloroflexota bacterium]